MPGPDLVGGAVLAGRAAGQELAHGLERRDRDEDLDRPGDVPELDGHRDDDGGARGRRDVDEMRDGFEMVERERDGADGRQGLRSVGEQRLDEPARDAGLDGREGAAFARGLPGLGRAAEGGLEEAVDELRADDHEEPPAPGTRLHDAQHGRQRDRVEIGAAPDRADRGDRDLDVVRRDLPERALQRPGGAVEDGVQSRVSGRGDDVEIVEDPDPAGPAALTDLWGLPVPGHTVPCLPIEASRGGVLSRESVGQPALRRTAHSACTITS